MSVKERLGEKAGPLPVYGWILIISAGIAGIWYYQKKKSAASSTDNTDQTTGDTSTDTAEGITPQQYMAGLIGSQYDLSNQLGETTSDIANLATNVGANTKAESANTAATTSNTSAVARNTGAENAGTAAEKTNTSTVKANTSAVKAHTPKRPVRHTTTTHTKKARTYTVHSGDTLSGIAARYHTTWQKIYEKNRKVVGANPNLIRPGEKLVIP